MMLLQQIGLCALATVSLHVNTGNEIPGGVRVGDIPEFTFSIEVLNGAGVVSLDDLRGTPVLFDFWGRECIACVGSSVPHSLKIAKEYGDDLVVILIESQGATSDEAEYYAYKNRWMQPDALWTSEAPFRLGRTGLPHVVLLSADGEVVFKGDPMRMRKKIDEAVEAEVESVREGPAGTARAIQRAYSDFVDGKYGQAMALVRRAQGGKNGDQAALALHSFQQRLHRRTDRIERMIEQGHLAEAEEKLMALAKGSKGAVDLARRVNGMLESLRAPGHSRELAADQAFQLLRKRARAKGLTSSVIRDLQRFSERHVGAAAGKRAQHLLSLSER